MSDSLRLLLSGDEAVAHAARAVHVALGTGYPGTPSTEILEVFHELGGHAEWAPNEKVAFEVAIGAAFGGANALVTMKHVGLNVAADPLFTVAYTGVSGGLVVVSADDPGMSSSQNEQDNRRYAVAAGVPMFEPADSQEAYDFLFTAFEVSRRWQIPVLFRMTTRVCHSKSIVHTRPPLPKAPGTHFEHDLPGRVMIPSNAKPAHRRLRGKLVQIAEYSETCPLNRVFEGSRDLGLVTSGVSFAHAREAAPGASILKLGFTYPLPYGAIRRFVESVKRCVVVEEGDPYLVDELRAHGMNVEGKAEMFRFGELNVGRVRRILAKDVSPESAPPRGKAPQLCPACPHRTVYEAFKALDLIAAGDIGCYSLGALPPFDAMDSLVCMGAAIGVGLGLRHVLPPERARKVVSVIGDSTFVHSGITGLVEMAYNPPPTGHVVVIVDNSTTAMTGLQEHPATGRTLGHEPTHKLNLEELARSIGIPRVKVVDPAGDVDGFRKLLEEELASGKLSVIIARRPCLLAAAKIRGYEQRAGK